MVAITGMESGMMTRQKMPSSLQPSIRAASCRSAGMASKNFIMMNMFQGLTIIGMMSAQTVLTSPSQLTTR